MVPVPVATAAAWVTWISNPSADVKRQTPQRELRGFFMVVDKWFYMDKIHSIIDDVFV